MLRFAAHGLYQCHSTEFSSLFSEFPIRKRETPEMKPCIHINIIVNNPAIEPVGAKTQYLHNYNCTKMQHFMKHSALFLLLRRRKRAVGVMFGSKRNIQRITKHLLPSLINYSSYYVREMLL